MMEEAKKIISKFRTMEKNELLPYLHKSGVQQLLALKQLAFKGFLPNGEFVGFVPAIKALPKDYVTKFNKCLGIQ